MRERHSVGDKMFASGAHLSMMKSMKQRLQEATKHYEALDTTATQPPSAHDDVTRDDDAALAAQTERLQCAAVTGQRGGGGGSELRNVRENSIRSVS